MLRSPHRGRFSSRFRAAPAETDVTFKKKDYRIMGLVGKSLCSTG
jgi:hypothetical protein